MQAQVVQGLQSVDAVVYDVVAAALPVQQGGQVGADQGVVIHDQCPDHVLPSFSQRFSGSRSRTQVETFGWLSTSILASGP